MSVQKTGEEITTIGTTAEEGSSAEVDFVVKAREVVGAKKLGEWMPYRLAQVDHRVIVIEVPDGLEFCFVKSEDLSANWPDDFSEARSAAIGSDWAASLAGAVRIYR